MEAIIYGLCALTSLLCAWMLFQSYGKRSIALLFWCGLFFAFQSLSNLFIIIDDLMLPDIDLSVYRYLTSFVAIAILVYGLIMKVEVD